MKLTRKKLRKLIMEIIYINPEGEAVAPDNSEPYSFLAGHPNEKIKTLGSHEDKQIRKMAAHLADSLTGSGAQKYSTMGAKEEEVHQMHKDLEQQHQQDLLKKHIASPWLAKSKRDQDTINKNERIDPRHTAMTQKQVNKYKPQIENVVENWVFLNNRYYDYLENVKQRDSLSLSDAKMSFLYDASEIVLQNIQGLSKIIRFYDSKMMHRQLDEMIYQISSVINDYLMYDRGLYDLFHLEEEY